MRVLILSFYYPPDIGPAPLRAQSLVNALTEVADDSLQIDVLTTRPNRYRSLIMEAPDEEVCRQVSIRRFPLPPHQSGMGDQARAFLSYSWAVHRETRQGRWDVVVATSSRLMTAALAAWVARRVGAKLYLDIRDLFTDTMEDVLKTHPLRIFMPIFRRLEKWTFESADKLNVVSAGFLPHITNIRPALKPSVLTNGIDDEFLVSSFCSPQQHELPLVVYAGNMGEGQGLHQVLPPVAVALKREARFRLIGDGGRKRNLLARLERSRPGNVEVLPPVPRQQLFAHYQEANILFLHLNDHKAFQKVLPSKIFEYAATGKPILAGVAGYAASFLQDQVPGVAVFQPCDERSMIYAIHKLLSGPRFIDRTEFCSRYLRKSIMRKMAEEVVGMR
jgi:glycosyltransferase involved in cell wall biosynthesis